MADIRFLGRATVRGNIHVLTGLHIGAGKDKIEIGGVDNPVVRHPHTGDPYIPGSSIKGKLRFMLEWAFNKIRADGDVWGWDTKHAIEAGDPVLRIFGTALSKDAWGEGPTRLVVRDANLNRTWRETADERRWDLVEEKTEVGIDRIAGKAADGRLRQTERVPAGAEFDLEMSFRLYAVNGDGGRRDWACLNWLLQGLAMLEDDALGGSGSRGYGRVRFDNLILRYDGADTQLDNTFRAHRFNPSTPAEIVPCPFGA